MDSTVLLVGDIGPRFELELVQAGFACAQASTANDAVAQMKSTRFPVVVVPPALSDMGGVEFIQGVLRYFDANVVLFGAANGAGGEVEALLRTGRVAHLPSQEGRPLVEILARSVPRASSPPAAAPMFNLTPGAPAPSSMGQPALGASFLGAAPHTPMGGVPSLPPGGLAASLFAPGGQLGSLPPSGPPASQRPVTFPSMPAVSMPSAGSVAPSFQSQMGQPQFGQASMPPGLVDELARAKADLVAMQSRLSSVEQERAVLATEVEASRRSAAMEQVAQVMALSDEGDPITEELEGLRDKAMEAEAKLEALKEEVGALRTERDRLVAEGVTSSQALAEARAKADAAAAELAQAKAELERAKAELAQAGESEVNLAELRLRLGERESEIDMLKKLGESQSGELEEAQNAAEGARADLEQTRTELAAAKTDFEAARAAADGAEKALEEGRAQLKTVKDVEGALRAELDKTRADVAAARTDATTSRLDLQEAMMRLDEAQTTLDQLKKDEAQLRAEAEPLRTWAQQIVAEHASQQAELEKLRKELTTLTDKATKAVALERQLAELQIQVDAHKDAPAAGATPAGDNEVLLARSRQLAQLVQALEPFMWGLTQATIFFTKSKADGSDEHVRLLQQLQGVLLRLRDEIAMLDL